MAEIYEANDTFYHRPVSIKIMKDTSLTKEDVNRFKNEINFASALNNDHIYKIYNVGDYENRPFMVYEAFKGKTLKDALDERGHFTSEESINFLLQICDGVKTIHSHEITHNDLKPDNIMILHDNALKIVDFGIATHIYDNEVKTLLASAQYVAPEVIISKKYTKQSDIYSLGIILFEFLTGKTPYLRANTKEEIHAHLYENIPSLNMYGDFPNMESLDLIIKKATNKKINERYSTVSEMIQDLNHVKNGEKIKKKSLFGMFM